MRELNLMVNNWIVSFSKGNIYIFVIQYLALFCDVIGEYFSPIVGGEDSPFLSSALESLRYIPTIWSSYVDTMTTPFFQSSFYQHYILSVAHNAKKASTFWNFLCCLSCAIHRYHFRERTFKSVTIKHLTRVFITAIMTQVYHLVLQKSATKNQKLGEKLMIFYWQTPYNVIWYKIEL